MLHGQTVFAPAVGGKETPWPCVAAPAAACHRTSGRPASWQRVSALRVAIVVGTLPYMLVRPSTSISGLLNAARMAIESSVQSRRQHEGGGRGGGGDGGARHQRPGRSG